MRAWGCRTVLRTTRRSTRRFVFPEHEGVVSRAPARETEEDMPAPAERQLLFHFDGGAGFGELFLEGFGFFLGDALFDRLGRAIH